MKSPPRRAGRGRDHPKQKQATGRAASIAKGHSTCLVLLGCAGRESLAARSARVAQAAGAGDQRHRDPHSSPAVTSQQDVTSQSRSNDISLSNPHVTALGGDITEQAGLQSVLLGAVDAGTRPQGRSTWVRGTKVRHLGQDTQMGAGRGDNSEGQQWGPQLHPRWVTPAPHP